MVLAARMQGSLYLVWYRVGWRECQFFISENHGEIVLSKTTMCPRRSNYTDIRYHSIHSTLSVESHPQAHLTCLCTSTPHITHFCTLKPLCHFIVLPCTCPIKVFAHPLCLPISVFLLLAYCWHLVENVGRGHTFWGHQISMNPCDLAPPRIQSSPWLAGCVLHADAPGLTPAVMVYLNSVPVQALLDSSSSIFLVWPYTILMPIQPCGQLVVTCVHGGIREVPATKEFLGVPQGESPLLVGLVPDLLVPLLVGRD